ncbi:LuxR C-terminal-related transcriptional regulator [Negadavirga shengliensis]|uniref:LuxR C-terminal-related transcriptional regulator n=1 Tax=Negadavirga shengliensis TaxID=1389218 RepID=A0ABV9T1T3_9BACT
MSRPIYPAQQSMQSGQEALATNDWEKAKEYFSAAVRIEETPECLEYLGLASWWLDDAATTFSCREKAYRLYRELGDNKSAARVAIALAFDYFSFQGEFVIANGWSRRAHRLLEDLAPGVEHAMVKIFDGYVAVEVHHDPEKSFRLGTEIVELARQLNEFDFLMMGLATEGLALVCQGHVKEGMQRLDETATAALAGEIGDLDIAITVCCYLISACERVRDYGRAVQWCFHVNKAAGSGKYPLMFSQCQIHYSGILIWQGDWDEAEALLETYSEKLISSRPAHAAEGILLRADLYRKRGKMAEATELIKQAGARPFRILGANRLLLAKSALAYDLGDFETAGMLSERYLRNTPESCRLALPPALELHVLIMIALGKILKATESAAALRKIADTVGTEPLLATAAYVEGTVAIAQGDYAFAYKSFELALELFEQNKNPFEAARARTGLAQAMYLQGQKSNALAEVHLALGIFESLGAVIEKQRARVVLNKIKSAQPRQLEKNLPETLTHRELEILREMAAGRDNAEIARKLFISIRTAERHISNIYGKIGASGKAARAFTTAFAHRNHLLGE